MKIIRMFLFLSLTLAISQSFPVTTKAKIYSSSNYSFSIQIPDEWSKRPSKQKGTLVVYAHMGSGENLNINVKDAPGIRDIGSLRLEDLFSPFFHLVNIENQNYIVINGTRFLKCIYSIEDSPIKRKLEGKYDLKYLVYSGVKNEKLYTITFIDSKREFHLHYPTFQEIITSIYFHE